MPPPCNSAELHSRIQYRVSEKWAYNTESLTQKPTSPNHRLPLTAFETHSGRSIFAARTALPAPKRPLRNAVARAAPMVMGALASSSERYRSIEILVDAPN